MARWFRGALAYKVLGSYHGLESHVVCREYKTKQNTENRGEGRSMVEEEKRGEKREDVGGQRRVEVGGGGRSKYRGKGL